MGNPAARVFTIVCPKHRQMFLVGGNMELTTFQALVLGAAAIVLLTEDSGCGCLVVVLMLFAFCVS